ncbi:3-hydroxybutyrate oligomer hydrolase family protein [Duganella phyllosphaerae]|uniref:D-(-)-3-hydroxybutyrate oligomer hydrolase n=1 Tax=Duganella phyllosphaerae TaxID=762836 RepID=A0A1E7WGS5_9BURK|nr:3-hydroxybutyrate oligomer hydrolase family protein [Duganella phyllosphaerae]OEZ97650.1 D-(-)-3-hydroxybutyrate oligomer hydrolase [Duganella phyllosphaerae]
MKTTTLVTAVSAAVATMALAGCGSHGHHHQGEPNEAPRYLRGITVATYDGVADDLLTGGLGASGLSAAAPAPGYADPLNPTPAELRRNAIYFNYRAIADVNPTAGYGRLYGPNVDINGVPTTGEGKIAGTEYIAYADDGSGKQNVTVMVQIPDSFDVTNPCIITGASSGSRGVYGAIATSGEWGLTHKCAVAYTDKGTGTGLYTFEDDSVNLRNGVRAPRATAALNANFAPTITDAERAAFAAAYPGRIASKHAHSQQNPEKDWGMHVLQSVEFAFYALNEKYGEVSKDGKGRRVRFTPRNTITIGSSISNGAAAALLAAEQDRKGLITGLAVSEPQIQPKDATSYSVRQNGAPVTGQGKLLIDYSTYAALYQPCIAATAATAARCTALAAKGLLAGADLAAQQLDARARLRAYGWLPESDPLQATYSPTNVLVAVTYSFAYGRFAPTDKVCGFTFAPVDAAGLPTVFTPAQKAASFATQNGIIGTPIYEDSAGGARSYALGVSPSTNLADQSLDGFLCLRALATGIDPVNGNALTGALAEQSRRVRQGAAEVVANGKLNGKPAIIVHGRSDTMMVVNFTSRAYLGLNAAAEGSSSKLRYIEVTNGNHFDVLTTALPQYVIPLNVYLFRALDAMMAHLRSNAQLPPSQVVRTTTRPDNTVPLTEANLPPFVGAPAPANAITVSAATVDVPQ